VTIIGQLSINSQALNTVAALTSGAAVLCFGGAMYALHSNFNHSCEPNAMVCATSMGNHEILLKTSKEIRKGDEITISYIPTQGLSVEERRRLLKPYFFECACPLCEKESVKPLAPSAEEHTA
jgi:hypothetical protein